MDSTIKPRVKICCIQNKEEAFAAIDFGASALGLVSEMPSGPGPIPDDRIAGIAAVVPPPIATFLLTSRTDAQHIIKHQQQVKTNTIQIVDKLQTGTYQDIRNALPGIRIIQVIHVIDESSIEEAIDISNEVDAILLDSGNPNLKIKELGGTGRVHNWDISRKIRESIDIPVFLAGGLNSENVREAIETVQPFGVDVCSGVRTGGKLDLIKLKRFFTNIPN
jgi:phosphoribosylanthranilate isomerase